MRAGDSSNRFNHLARVLSGYGVMHATCLPTHPAGAAAEAVCQMLRASVCSRDVTSLDSPMSTPTALPKMGFALCLLGQQT